MILKRHFKDFHCGVCCVKFANNWRRRNITNLCRILVCFFLSKWAEFLHVLSDVIESHSPEFFSTGLRFVFQLKRMQKNLATLFAVCCWTTSKRNLLFSRTKKTAKRPVAACFLHTFLLKNKAQTREKNYTGLWLSVKSESTCKNSAHLDEKKKQNKIWHRMVMLRRLQLWVP